MSETARRRRLILLVDPDPHFRAHLRLALEAAGFSVGEAANGRAGERTIARVRPDAVIVDLLVESSQPGRSVAEMLSESGSEIPLFLIGSGVSYAADEMVDIHALKIAGVFPKPVDTALVIQTLKTRLKTG